MVGLVVVSHSRALARAAVALAAEMVPDRRSRSRSPPGWTRPRSAPTPSAITEAMAAADHGDGVVVLMDLGSAVLSAELALDLLADDDARPGHALPGPDRRGPGRGGGVRRRRRAPREVAAEAL
jgi:dihydroxyacetone kinase DhaKLM complex PTS-EIIA-like component DhaM